MSPELLDSCRQFYIQCVARGRIPVSTSNGKWGYSSEPSAFNDYLARFNADERRYIKKGVPLIKDISSSRASKILSELSGERREALRQAVLENESWTGSAADMT